MGLLDGLASLSRYDGIERGVDWKVGSRIGKFSIGRERDIASYVGDYVRKRRYTEGYQYKGKTDQTIVCEKQTPTPTVKQDMSTHRPSMNQDRHLSLRDLQHSFVLDNHPMKQQP
jgi:hypothetical protein